MYVAQKHNRNKKNSIIFLTLLLLLIFSTSFCSFADNNDEFITHKVTNGDTLWIISKRYSVPLESILVFNNIKDKDTLSIGQIIKIPQDNPSAADYNIHTVKKGETLWSIAQEFNLSVNLILATNNFANPELISIGQQIEIPGVGGGIPDPNQKQEPIIIVYTVVKGDTLWEISQRYDVNMSTIISTNNLKEITRLSIGQKLELPINNMDIAKAEGYSQGKEAEEIIYYVKKG